MFELRTVREELILRRGRLAGVVHAPGAPADLHRLLHEVDQALARIEAGSFGLCETCGDPIEADRLAVDPLTRFCIDHLSDREARALERDLELAARVQAGLLPCNDPGVPGWTVRHRYVPAGLVGGDYLDLLPGPDGALYATVGDVSGKGVAASLLMAHLAALVRTLAGLGPSPAALIERANRLFCESTIAAQYATLFCVRAAADGAIDFSGAGHPPALLATRGDGVRTLESTGLPIGMFCASPYAASDTRLAPGDTLLLYTDGVPETHDAAGREYGVGRLREVLGDVAGAAPDAVADAILDDVTAFRGAAPPTDDLTLLVLRRSAA
jgi:sigma-B regulation protein RsbU (phosphoserine phosphatase)